MAKKGSEENGLRESWGIARFVKAVTGLNIYEAKLGGRTPTTPEEIKNLKQSSGNGDSFSLFKARIRDIFRGK